MTDAVFTQFIDFLREDFPLLAIPFDPLIL
jgi:hypothetical protein